MGQVICVEGRTIVQSMQSIISVELGGRYLPLSVY